LSLKPEERLNIFIKKPFDNLHEISKLFKIEDFQFLQDSAHQVLSNKPLLCTVGPRLATLNGFVNKTSSPVPGALQRCCANVKLLYQRGFQLDAMFLVSLDMSTCCTFLTRRSTLVETREIFKSYKDLGDYLMWYLLTRMIPIKDIIKISYRPRYLRPRYLRRMMSLLRYARKFSAKSTYSLWAPEPTIATHMQRGCLSPKINWEKYFRNINEIVF